MSKELCKLEKQLKIVNKEFNGYELCNKRQEIIAESTVHLKYFLKRKLRTKPIDKYEDIQKKMSFIEDSLLDNNRILSSLNGETNIQQKENLIRRNCELKISLGKQITRFNNQFIKKQKIRSQ